MDLEILLSLKENMQQNKFDFNILSLDEDDLYDYYTLKDKNPILDLINY